MGNKNNVQQEEDLPQNKHRIKRYPIKNNKTRGSSKNLRALKP